MATTTVDMETDDVPFTPPAPAPAPVVCSLCMYVVAPAASPSEYAGCRCPNNWQQVQTELDAMARVSEGADQPGGPLATWPGHAQDLLTQSVKSLVGTPWEKPGPLVVTNVTLVTALHLRIYVTRLAQYLQSTPFVGTVVPEIKYDVFKKAKSKSGTFPNCLQLRVSTPTGWVSIFVFMKNGYLKITISTGTAIRDVVWAVMWVYRRLAEQPSLYQGSLRPVDPLRIVMINSNINLHRNVDLDELYTIVLTDPRYRHIRPFYNSNSYTALKLEVGVDGPPPPPSAAGFGVTPAAATAAAAAAAAVWSTQYGVVSLFTSGRILIKRVTTVAHLRACYVQLLRMLQDQYDRVVNWNDHLQQVLLRRIDNSNRKSWSMLVMLYQAYGVDVFTHTTTN